MSQLLACPNNGRVQKIRLPQMPFLVRGTRQKCKLYHISFFQRKLIDPKSSWIGKWQRLGSYRPGIYAMVVHGELGEDFIDLVERDGRVYINRSSPFVLN